QRSHAPPGRPDRGRLALSLHARRRAANPVVGPVAVRAFGRWLLWLMLAGLALQLFFLGRIALMAALDPHSTAFQRSEAWRIAVGHARGEGECRWRQQWEDGAQFSPLLWRAVFALEYAGFFENRGVEWEATQKAWQKNERRQE